MPRHPIQNLLRNFVLFTSRGPLLLAYRMVYRGIATTAALFLGRLPGVRAVYLRRGCAKGETIPGVSDIDLAVITGHLQEQEQARLKARYDSLQKRLVLLDDSLEQAEEQRFLTGLHTIRYRYRIAEGKATWLRLHGKDYLDQIPALEAEHMPVSIYHEFHYWWMMFSLQLLHKPASRDDRVLRNSICFKTAIEFLKTRLALEEGIVAFGRQETLRKVQPFLSDEEAAFVDRLRRLSRARFLASDESILGATTVFLLGFLNRFHKEFGNHPCVRLEMPASLEVSGPRRHWFWPPERNRHARRLAEYVRKRWAHGCRSIHITKTTDHDVSNFAFLIDVDGVPLPSMDELLALKELHALNGGVKSHRLHIYLLQSHCAVHIDLTMGGWPATLAGILSPHTNPEVFEMLAREESLLSGSLRPGFSFPGWTPMLSELVRERAGVHSGLLRDENNVRTIGFYSAFWKVYQSRVTERFLKRRRAVFPLTTWEIKERGEEDGISVPARVWEAISVAEAGDESLVRDVATAREASDWLASIKSQG